MPTLQRSTTMLGQFTVSVLLFLLSLPYSTSSHASLQVDQTPTDLLQALNMALDHDPEWQSTQKQITAEQEGRIQVRSELLPSITLSGETAKVKTEYENTALDSEGNINSLSLSISQPLFRLDTWFRYKAEQRLFDQLTHQLSEQYQAFIISVSIAYLDVLRAESQLTFSEAELTAIRQQLEQAQQRFRVGLIAITDVHEAQAAYDLAEVNQIASATDLDIAYENLSRLTGTLVERIHQVHPDMPIADPEPNNMSEWVKKAQAQNPSVLRARAARQAAKASLKATRALYAPTVNLVANHSKSNPIDESLDSDITSLAVQLSMPLFQGFNTVSRNRKAKLRHLASTDDLTTAMKDAAQITRNLFRSVRTDVLRVNARRQAITSSNSALEATEAGYEVGTRNVVDVLNAQRSLFAAKRDYASSKYDFILHSLQLKQAAGSLTADDIEQLNGWLIKQ